MTKSQDRKIKRPSLPRKRSVRGKLALLVVVSVGLAVALVAGVSAWREGARAASQDTARLTAAATILASSSAEAAAAGDRARAFQSIRSISQMPGVTYARIQFPDGRLLVETGRGARLTRDISAGAGENGKPGLVALLTSRTQRITAPIVSNGREVGTVVMLGQTEGVADRFKASLGTSLIAALAAILLGLAVAWRLQRGITMPILALTKSMGEVQRDHDYGRTVEITADDEVGELVRGFNGMLAQIRDRDAKITEHVEGLEHQVAARTADYRQAADEAESANRAKSDFLATMSHEIRTPMNGIMVMAEMLAAGEMPPRQRRFAEVIAKSGSSLLAIINDILDFSKIEAGKMELEEVPVDLSDIVEDVSSLFWERASSKGLDLAAYIDPATPKVVAADPVRLRQVVSNLVNNAIKFTEVGGVMIEVEPDGADSVRIAVHDTGIGIPKDKIGDVFGAFSQADQSTTRKFGGTGLGLSICKKLVDAMGGRFAVTSDVGRGSTFAFHLPVRVITGAEPWPDPAEAVGGGKPVAVIAHAGLSTRRALGRYLARAGFTVATPEDKDAIPSLAIASASELKTLGAVAGPIVCLGDFGDAVPQQLQRAGKVQAVLIQPFRGRDLHGLLTQLSAGEELHEVDSRASDAAISEALPQFAGARVLVADDSAVNREVALEALARLGVEPKLVNDGREAVEAVMAETFELVLMDGSMPDMDGYEATREIRRLEGEKGGHRTPIVALTAHVVGSAAEAWSEAGMDGVLHKPFTLASLAKTVGQYLTQTEAVATVVTAPVVAQPAPVAPLSAVTMPMDSELIDPEIAEQLMAMAGAGKSDFVAKVQGLYRDNAPGCIGQVRDALKSGDESGAAKGAHALKSMSFNIGAREVSRLAAEMENSAREGRMPTEGEVAALEDVLKRTLAVLSGEAAPSVAPAVPDNAPAPTMDSETRSLLYDLQRAIERDELSLVYQPQYDRDGVAILGVETLVRWTHPVRGPVRPDLFIPLAEAHGLIAPVTTWVFDKLMTETKDLTIQVGFNASALEFAEPGFVGRIDRLIRQHGYDHRRLEIEITETAILSAEEQVRENMQQLQKLGLKVALDDFGAGYSSLRHLRRFPFDKLKIDREFITDCTGDVQSATVVHAVVSIGRALGMKVVAEGVETELQRKFLKVAGVHALQGFLFGKPLPIDALELLLTANPEERFAVG